MLKIDLNTLLSFNDDLTDIEIENFVNEVDKTAREQGYAAAFQKAINKIHEYPTCEKLIYSVILYLEGALTLYNVSEIEQYQKMYETFYKRLATSEIPEIRDTATRMLISYARNRGDFLKAEELINSLPFSSIDKEEQLAILYQRQERYPDADFFADMYEAVTRQFCFPEWMCYSAHLQLAFIKKDRSRSLAILQKMLPAMKKEWNPQDYRLYRNANVISSTFFSKLAKTITDELANSEEYAFLRDGSEFKELMAQLKE